MKRLMRIAVAFGLLLAANGAFAQDNTDAGVVISNTATVNYEVNNIPQSSQANTPATFMVDRVILVTVANTSGATVTPGQDTDDTVVPVLTFTVTNDSNATLDFVLSTEDLAGDDFDATGLEIFVDGNANGTFEAANDTATSISDLAEEGVATVFVIGDIPLSAANDDFDDVVLVATAYEIDGTTLVQDDDADNNDVADSANGQGTMETVFGDADGTGVEGAEDGAHSDTGRFTVGTASIAVAKQSVVISDPFNDTTNPKAIPGAVVEYCILVTNSGGTDATDVAISDPIPEHTTYVAESIQIADDCAGTGAVAVDDDVLDESGDETGTESGSFDAAHDAGYGGAPKGRVLTAVDTLPDGDPTPTTTATIFRVTID